MELAERYMPLAESMAWARGKSLPANVTIDEIRSAALYGLADAASKYDPERGVPFPSYARTRISGEISDFFRRVSYECAEPDDLAYEAPPGRVETDDFFDFVCEGLSAADGKMVRMYYVDGRSLKEVGKARGVGEARASQILKACHKSIKRKLKKGCFS